MSEKIKISVITITKNCKDKVTKTVDSVLGQSYCNIEYIIIDGLSDDGTAELIETQYKDRISLFVSERDNGISEAFNKGLQRATGELVIFLNAGDYFLDSGVLEKVADCWADNPKDVLFFQVRLGEHSVMPDVQKTPAQIWKNAELPHQGTFIVREKLVKLGGFDERIRIRMDYDLFMRCVQNHLSYQYISEPIVQYELGGCSMAEKNAKLFYQEEIEIKRKYGCRVEIKDYLYLYMPKWVRRMGRKLIRR